MFEQNILEGLNEEQKIAITESFDTNTVVIAGAGAGKTTVLTTRVQYLLDVLDAKEGEIMVVTFTNKAAGELKSRMAAVTTNIDEMYIGTFHSICIKLLKEYGSYIGIGKFSILTPYQAKALLKPILEKHGEDTEQSNLNKYINLISLAKCDLKNPSVVRQEAKTNLDTKFADIYRDFNNKCWEEKKLDFDDLIVYTTILIHRHKDVKEDIHYRFKYICCDETQDTNSAQFRLLYEIAGDNNLFLVGDTEQSIYGFRKARPSYIMNFKALYKDSKTLFLNRNYRSTQTIVNAGNDLVNNNTIGFKKECYSMNKKGDPIMISNHLRPEDEAAWIAGEIQLLNQGGIPYDDMAILFRTNQQSRVVEEACRKEQIPVVVIDGVSFYKRKEIKDMLSIAKLLTDNFDLDSFKRVMGLLPGVGKKTIELIENAANVGFSDYITTFLELKVPAKAEKSKEIIRKLQTIDLNQNAGKILEQIALFSNIIADLKNEGTQTAIARVDNIKELINLGIEFSNQNPNGLLASFLDEVALSDASEEGASTQTGVNLMTLHASKGLEFEVVFIIGAEENIIPHFRAKGGSDLEEERRLMYVGITRAKSKLYITSCEYRQDGDYDKKTERSRFIEEIPEQYCVNL